MQDRTLKQISDDDKSSPGRPPFAGFGEKFKPADRRFAGVVLPIDIDNDIYLALADFGSIRIDLGCYCGRRDAAKAILQAHGENVTHN
jgi:hypothetical protein